MSPSAAWASDVFRTYFALSIGLISVVTALLVGIRVCLHKRTDHAWRSLAGWMGMVPLVLVALFLGRGATIVFFAAISLRAFHEYARATALIEDRWLVAIAQVGIVAIAASQWLTDPRLGVPGWYGLFMALPAYVVLALLVVPIVRDRSTGALGSTSVGIMGFLYFGWMFGHVGYLANTEHAYGYLMFLIFAVALNDVAAYTWGRLFGRRALRPAISPNKTWEGAVGALAISMVLPWLLRFSFPHVNGAELIAIGLIVGVAGQLGDLVISVIKRDLGIKDMGSAIPGHGGVLDRVDSLIFVAPLYFHLIRWTHGLYPA